METISNLWMGWKIWCQHGFTWVFFPSQNYPACISAHSGGKGPLPNVPLSHGEATVAPPVFGQKQTSDSVSHTLPHSIPRLGTYPHQVFHFQPEEISNKLHLWIPQKGITPKSRPQLVSGRENQLRPNSELLQWDPVPVGLCHPRASRSPRPVKSIY